MSSLPLTCSGTSFHPTRDNNSGNHLFILLVIIIPISTQMHCLVWGIIEIIHPLSKWVFREKEKKTCSMWQSDTKSKRVSAHLCIRLPFVCREQEWEWLHLNELPLHMMILVGICSQLPLSFQSRMLKIGVFLWSWMSFVKCPSDRPELLVWTLYFSVFFLIQRNYRCVLIYLIAHENKHEQYTINKCIS